MANDEVSLRAARYREAQALCREVGRDPHDVDDLMWALDQLDQRDDKKPA